MVGDVPVGGGAPVSVQSMTNTDTSDERATLEQIEALARIGCEIARVAVPDDASAAALPSICKRSPIPVIADIHFDYRLALAAVDAGVHGLRVNPGTLGGGGRVEEVARAVREARIPVRIGVNAGSMEKEIVRQYGGATAEAMFASAMKEARMFEDHGVTQIKLSLKASDVPRTVQAYRLAARECDYPLHLGITEAGTRFAGSVRSAVGIGALLLQGIGDTIRISLSGDPLPEVRTGWEILKAVGLRDRGITVISCPTCARAADDVARMAEAVEADLADRIETAHIAVMGCTVNGPGECRDADVGVFARGGGRWLLYRSGEHAGEITVREPADLIEVIRRVLDQKSGAADEE